MAIELRLRMLGIRELNHLPGTKRLLLEKATRIALAADAAANDPDGHEVETGEGIRRSRAAVITATHKAMYMEATIRSLTKSIGAGRG